MFIKNNSPLGAKIPYPKNYSSSLLHPIPREKGIDMIKLDVKNGFYGEDIWNAYEISWLNLKGKPVVATAQIVFQYDTKNIIESKSLKLYFNSMNQTKYESKAHFLSVIIDDISNCAGGSVEVVIFELGDLCDKGLPAFSGILLDDLDVMVEAYDPDPSLLDIEHTDKLVTETLYSHLLKTNCPVTDQPDWASIMIRYTGQPIDRDGLLKYIISYRNQQDFHEQCVERIFLDISSSCLPNDLEVYARYTRRGGLDINPYRSSKKMKPPLARISRQ